MDINTATLIMPIGIILIVFTVSALWFYTRKGRMKKFLEKILDFLGDIRF